MPTIKTIHIKNFRSIINQTIEVEDFNVFVGMNDSGKSNVLKALNLFFNGQTDGDTPFDFKVDFSKHAASLVHKAKEIRITLTIVPPPTYSDKEVEWTKCWRAEGEHSLKDEGIKITIPKEPTKGTYTRMFLNRIRYKYVPAIKSDDFSARLLGELYLCVSAEENSDFRKRMDDYANALQQYTQSISTEIKAKIGMDSKIIRSTRPTADFFSSLIFNTASEGFDVLLQQRGDGIKARHIPAILKFISAHQPKEQHQKAPYTTIWGYEEPETALELSQCFEFANEFVAYSKNIQVFLTSHSPAFYMICASEKKQGKRFYVNRTNNTTSISETEESSILAAIAPYFAEIQRLNAEIGKAKKPLLFVEGDYDIRYLKKAAELLDRNGPLDSFQMVDSEGYGNIEKVAKHFDSKLAFVTPQIIVLLYDCDIKKTENEKGNIFIRVMQTVNTNPLKKGIENLFAKDLLDKAIQHKPAFIDVTQATTKTVRGQEEEVPETWEANKDEKKNLCDWIIANGTKEDFQSFNRVFDILQNILE